MGSCMPMVLTWTSKHTHIHVNKIREDTSNLMMSLKALEKQEQTKPPNSRQDEIIKIMAEIHEIGTTKKFEQSMR